MSRTRPAAAAASSSISEIARAMARASPDRTRSARGIGALTSGSQQLAGDDEALHFAGAFADRHQLDVAKKFLRRIILYEPIAAVHLHAIFGGAHRDLT